MAGGGGFVRGFSGGEGISSLIHAGNIFFMNRLRNLISRNGNMQLYNYIIILYYIIILFADKRCLWSE